MRKTLLFLSCSFLFACTKTDIAPAPEAKPIVQQYLFKKITFKEDTITRIIETKTTAFSSITINNGTSVTQHLVFKPGAIESSYFEVNNEMDSLLKTQDTTYLLVPIGLGSNSDYILGGQKWPLTSQYHNRPATSLQITDTIRAPAYTTVTVSGTITYQVLRAAYTVTFQGEKDGSELTYEGLWEGTTPISRELHYESENYKSGSLPPSDSVHTLMKS